MTNIEQAIQIIKAEGYYFDCSEIFFNIEQDDEIDGYFIKRKVTLTSLKLSESDKTQIQFNVKVNPIDCNWNIKDYKKFAKYLSHMCKVAEDLNKLTIEFPRGFDFSTLNVNKSGG